MNAFNCAAVSMSLPRRRAATILLVPTSMPYGLALTRSSMRSSASCATFQRWSLRSLIGFVSLSVTRGHCLTLALLVSSLRSDPLVVQLSLLPPEIVQALSLLARLFRHDALAFRDTLPGVAPHAP